MEKKDENCCITLEASEAMSSYWDRNFEAKEVQNWSEPEDPAILEWFKKFSITKSARILCAGVGDANIIEALLDHGYNNIIANDISPIALERLKNRVNDGRVSYMVDDLIKPIQLQALYGTIDIYIDRATLHFFTACAQKDFYFSQLNSLLAPGGSAMIGVFSKDNVAKCCGLDLQLWSMQSLKNRMDGYEFLDEFDQAFEERNGRIRNYLYIMARKPLGK